jgi:hypothetical protein
MGILSNNLRKIVDAPVWEWTRFAPVATAAISATCSDDVRYFYYFSTTFWRFDAWADTWQQLATPNQTPTVVASLKYQTKQGNRGNVLAATSTTLKIAGIQSDILTGNKIRITSGTGLGQELTISSTAVNNIEDHGTPTTATASQLTDTTKRWRINQWVGYQVRLVYGGGASQIRKVIYNDATNLYLYDANFQHIDNWNNMSFSIITPYTVPSAAAASQTLYYIESTTITVPTMSPVPDATSTFMLLTGGIWLFSGIGTTAALQYYDVLSDTWINKTGLAQNILAVISTDASIETIDEKSGAFLTGRTATSGGARTISKSGDTYTVDAYSNYGVKITGGVGIGQFEKIVGNTSTLFEISRPWKTQPNNTSVFEIWGNTNLIHLAGHAQASMYNYLINADMWCTSPYIDYGNTNNISIIYGSQAPIEMSTGVRNTGGITALNATPTVGGTGYAVGDTFNITAGGTVGKGRVTSVTAGVVTGVELYSAGLTYTTGAGKSTTKISGGGDNALTVNITTTGTVGRITTSTSHNFYVGNSITVGGCSGATWNTTYSILACDSITTFDIIITAAGSAAASLSQTTTLIVDASKNWTANEHTGKLVTLYNASYAPTTTQIRRITSNTATSLVVATITSATVASRYVIAQPEAFGRDEQWKASNYINVGRAVSGTTYTLADTTKAWYSNQWNGYKYRILAGTGVGSEVAITGNTATALKYGLQTFTPDNTTKYIIMDTFGLVTGNVAATTLGDTTKNWTVNQWAAKKVRITSGTGLCQESLIASNTATVLTFGSITAPDTTSTYTILGVPARGASIKPIWVYGTTVTANKGRYIWCTRGGSSNVFDRYDITKNTWDLSIYIQPQTEIFTTGCMYSYDGVNNIVIHRGDAAATQRTFVLDVNKLTVNNIGQPPYNHSTPIIGNRMEVLTTVDGLKYVYIMRHTGQEMWRTLWWF